MPSGGAEIRKISIDQNEPAQLSEITEDSVPSSEGTGIALTSDASRSSTNYNLDGKRF